MMRNLILDYFILLENLQRIVAFYDKILDYPVNESSLIYHIFIIKIC